MDDLHVLAESVSPFGVAPPGETLHPVTGCLGSAESGPEFHSPVGDMVDRHDMAGARRRIAQGDLGNTRRHAYAARSLRDCGEQPP